MGKLFQSSFNIATMLENSLCMIKKPGNDVIFNVRVCFRDDFKLCKDQKQKN